MTGPLHSGELKQKMAKTVPMVLNRLYLDASALYGFNELSDLYESHNGTAYKPRQSNIVPVIRDIKAVIRGSNIPLLPHLELSFFGLAKELGTEVLFYQVHGRGQLRFSNLQPGQLGNLPQSGHQPRGIY